MWFRKPDKDGRLHGLYESYLENGQLWGIRNYKNGRFHGLYEDYYENGQLALTTNLIDGLRQDSLQLDYVFSNDGQLEKECYRNGSIVEMSDCDK